jgi:hypothetical protein
MSEKQAWALNGLVGVSPGGYARVGSHFGLTVDEATDLIYQLATAIEEAKRQVDPFERCLAAMEYKEGRETIYHLPNQMWASRAGARKVWDSIVAAMKEER